MSFGPPQSATDILQEVTARLEAVLGNVLTGVYLHGSLAMDCYNPDSSDIDLLVIVNKEVLLPMRRQLADLFIELDPKAPGGGFEVSVLTLEQLRWYTHPMPFEFHFSRMWADGMKNPEADLSTEGKLDPDLTAHLMITKHRGVVLYGRPIGDIFPDVPKEDYRKAIDGDLKDSLEDMSDDPVYAVLNLCRSWAFSVDGLILSKQEGGEWALERASASQRAIVEQALEQYKSGNEESWDTNKLDKFGKEIADILEIS